MAIAVINVEIGALSNLPKLSVAAWRWWCNHALTLDLGPKPIPVGELMGYQPATRRALSIAHSSGSEYVVTSGR